MPNRTFYEWDVETFVEYDGTDDEDIIDHSHSETVATLLPIVAHPDCAAPEGYEQGTVKARLVLVRDVFDDAEILVHRAWAYVDDGELPAEFDDGCKVPVRFHRELESAQKNFWIPS
jgi:hypothetical protein